MIGVNEFISLFIGIFLIVASIVFLAWSLYHDIKIAKNWEKNKSK